MAVHRRAKGVKQGRTGTSAYTVRNLSLLTQCLATVSALLTKGGKVEPYSVDRYTNLARDLTLQMTQN